MAILFSAKAIEEVANVEYDLAGQQAPWAGLVLYGFLGIVGLWLARRTGFPDLWEPEIANRFRFLLPAVTGAVTGLGMIAMDAWLRAGNYPQIPQTDLPEGLLLVIIAGISEEIALRLFLIPLLIWLTSSLLLGGRWQDQFFWGAAGIGAVLYSLLAVGAMVTRTNMPGVSGAPPFYLLGLPTILLYSMLAAYFFRRYGFLAVLSGRFGFYFVWHVLWPFV